jgi:hydrogenase maturation factor
MVMIVPPHQASDVLDRIHALGERAYRIGEIVVKRPDDAPIVLGPLGS